MMFQSLLGLGTYKLQQTYILPQCPYTSSDSKDEPDSTNNHKIESRILPEIAKKIKIDRCISKSHVNTYCKTDAATELK